MIDTNVAVGVASQQHFYQARIPALHSARQAHTPSPRAALMSLESRNRVLQPTPLPGLATKVSHDAAMSESTSSLISSVFVRPDRIHSSCASPCRAPTLQTLQSLEHPGGLWIQYWRRVLPVGKFVGAAPRYLDVPGLGKGWRAQKSEAFNPPLHARSDACGAPRSCALCLRSDMSSMSSPMFDTESTRHLCSLPASRLPLARFSPLTCKTSRSSWDAQTATTSATTAASLAPLRVNYLPIS